jgi:hypothetical protein
VSSAQQIHSPASAGAADVNASGDTPAQPSSAVDRAAATILQRIADTAERHGWRPQASRLSDFIECQLAELDRYRAADVERDARERENAVTAAHRTNEG